MAFINMNKECWTKLHPKETILTKKQVKELLQCAEVVKEVVNKNGFHLKNIKKSIDDSKE